MIAIAVFCRIRKLSFGRIADIISIGLVSCQMIAVWGNFFSREFIGEYTDSIFAMQIPAEMVGSNELTAGMQEHLIKTGDIACVQVHPLFFYESLWCLFLLCVLLVYTRKKKFQGEIFMRYLAPGKQSETEPDIQEKSDELPKTISDSEQTEDEIK